jgi:hypothetical protein
MGSIIPMRLTRGLWHSSFPPSTMSLFKVSFFLVYSRVKLISSQFARLWFTITYISSYAIITFFRPHSHLSFSVIR